MSYTAQTINVGDTITSAWGNKIEQHLERLGNYLGVVTNTAALPDPSTVDEGDWYLLSNKRGIYVMQGGEWRAIVDESLVKLWIGEPGASIQWSGGRGLLTVNSQVPLQKANLELYPITLVNLLGKYGNFETDSNEDGLADGWYDIFSACSYTLTNGFFGTKAQKLTTSADSEQRIVLITTPFKNNGDFIFPAGTCLFFTGYARKITENVDKALIEVKYLKISDSSWIWGALIFPKANNTHSIGLLPDTQWHKGKKIIHPTDSDFRVEFKIIFQSNGTDEQSIATDGFAAYNLTAMGILPPPLQQFFSDAGITRWDDLATTSNITGADGRTQTGEDWLAELLPYVDSVATVGYSWTDGQLTVTVENRGKNMVHLDAVHAMRMNVGANSITYDEASFIRDNNEFIVTTSVLYAGIYFSVGNLSNRTVTLLWKQKGIYTRANLIYRIGNLYFEHTDKPTYQTSTDYVERSYTWVIPACDEAFVGFIPSETGTFYVKDIQLEESSTASEYEPTRKDKMELSGVELYSYDGVYDELKGDTLIKRWTRETGISIVTEAGTVSQSGTGTCILVDESNGEVYTGTVSDTSISTSAPDGTYTVIYQLASPEYETLEAPLELPIVPGKNHIILPELAAVTLTGTDDAVRAGGTIITESNLTPNLIVSNTEPQLKIPNRTLWYDTNANALKLWDGTSWITI